MLSRQRLTVEAQMQTHIIHVGFVVDKVVMEQIFFFEHFGFPLQLISSRIFYTYLHQGMV